MHLIFSFLGVGNYAIVKDSWRGKEVNYYVEPEYASLQERSLAILLK